LINCIFRCSGIQFTNLEGCFHSFPDYDITVDELKLKCNEQREKFVKAGYSGSSLPPQFN